MNDTVKLPTASEAEVADFVARVRERLSDLPEDEREELVGGLEGDLVELQADGGSVRELGDPRAYADELRAAAGVAARGTGPAGPPRRGAADVVAAVLDRAHRGWDELMAVPPLDAAWAFLVTLRPVWWCLRAWAAVQLLDVYVGNHTRSALVPDLGHSPAFGLVVTLAAVLVSVQIGRGRWWPGNRLSARPGRRLLLLGLNVFALLVTPWLLAA